MPEKSFDSVKKNTKSPNQIRQTSAVIRAELAMLATSKSKSPVRSDTGTKTEATASGISRCQSSELA